jgi:hypothetical protein
MDKRILEWAYQYLASHGYQLESNEPEEVLSTPWSHVMRFATSDGYIYLKNTPSELALEADIIQMLRKQFNAPVAEVIAQNVELNSFLMKDAGKPLRGILKQKFDTDLYCKAILQFTAMQINVADQVDTLIDIGVPDWRLAKLPDLYMQLLSQKDMLLADGLSENEIDQLEKLYGIVSSLCQELSGYSIKPSLVQPDFHDNNILIADISQEITIIDLGEIAISHPFLSLPNCLDQAKKHHALNEEDNSYKQLMNACLENYMTFESKKNLLDAFANARTLRLIYAALCDYRLMVACEKAKFTNEFNRHGRVSVPLRGFMHAVEKT